MALAVRVVSLEPKMPLAPVTTQLPSQRVKNVCLGTGLPEAFMRKIQLTSVILEAVLVIFCFNYICFVYIYIYIYICVCVCIMYGMYRVCINYNACSF